LLFGAGAYGEALRRAREARDRAGAGASHWSRVAREIARRNGYVISDSATRWLQEDERREPPKSEPNLPVKLPATEAWRRSST
jgi:hypothetical protein